jgi:DNA polymerase-3 subunit delta'
MQTLKLSIDALAMHTPLWQRIQPSIEKKHLPHAFLFIGPRHAKMLPFTHRLIAMLLCEKAAAPCGSCQSCHLIINHIHPDIMYVRPDAASSPIKIEQIRELQQTIYQTPQRGLQRMIVIDPADKLNMAAANALLKVLEEPPLHTRFILLTAQLNSLPLTIISRCQQLVFPLPEYNGAAELSNYLQTATFYTEELGRAALLQQSASIIHTLCELVDKKIAPCVIATEWSEYTLSDLLWFLYLLTAQAIHCHLLGSDLLEINSNRLMYFAQTVKSVLLFKQLDKIKHFMQKIQRNITLNQALTLEAVLLGYLHSEEEKAHVG